MPSEKLTQILKAKSPFTAEEIKSLKEDEGWAWVYANAKPPKEKLSSVCFTGFSQAQKQELSTMAQAAHLRVVGSVYSSLAFLCAGDNAGPAKLAKAQEYGITVMNHAEFINFLETGEIPMPAMVL